MLSLWETHHVTGKKRGAATALRQVLAVAKAAGAAPVLIGAGALAAYGAPRYSEDIDFLLPRAKANRFVRGLIDAGFRGPAPSSGIYSHSLASPGGVEVDVLAATDVLPLDAIRSARSGIFLGEKVRVPAPEFYLLLKLLAADGDPARQLQHLGDIEQLLRVQPAVDMQFVGAYVGQNEPSLARIFRRLLTGLRLAKRTPPRPLR